LLSSQQSVRRLEAAAARAADAERHIAVLEDEQNKLHEDLRSSQEDARSHAQRFKEAQRGLTDMQDQLERMEKEARQERERHSEVVERMERQREIDKQLDMAAGRLKGAAASKQLQEPKSNNKIVGHFVRDLLEDNANLQVGIAELREMLLNSNDEIQSLREQLMFHQPVEHEQTQESGSMSTLKAELEPSDAKKRLSQELHIHHHYHVTPKSEAKKPKKRRQGLLSGTSTPPVFSAPSSPRRPGKWGGIAPSPTAPALLSHTDEGDMTPTMPKARIRPPSSRHLPRAHRRRPIATPCSTRALATLMLFNHQRRASTPCRPPGEHRRASERLWRLLEAIIPWPRRCWTLCRTHHVETRLLIARTETTRFTRRMRMLRICRLWTTGQRWLLRLRRPCRNRRMNSTHSWNTRYPDHRSAELRRTSPSCLSREDSRFTRSRRGPVR